MDDDSLRRIIAEIDELPRDGEPRSHAWIEKPTNYVGLMANKAGLVSLARAFLLAAVSPDAGPRLTSIDEPHLQVMKSKDDVAIGWIQQADVVPIPQEDIEARQREAWRNDRFFLLGCSLIGFVVLFLVISGLGLWIGIISGSIKSL